MTLAASTDLKQQIHRLIDQLPPEQLPQLLQLLQAWLAYSGAHGANGAGQLPATDALLEAEQPWLKYTTRLKESPNWDEFLEVIAEARRQTDEDSVGV